MTQIDPMRAIHAPARQRHDLRFSEDLPVQYYWETHRYLTLLLKARARIPSAAEMADQCQRWTNRSKASRKAWRSRKRMAKARTGKS